MLVHPKKEKTRNKRPVRSNDLFIECHTIDGDFVVIKKTDIKKVSTYDRTDDPRLVQLPEGGSQEICISVMIEYDDSQRGLAAIEVTEDYDAFVDRLLYNDQDFTKGLDDE